MYLDNARFQGRLLTSKTDVLILTNLPYYGARNVGEVGDCPGVAANRLR
jgi:hypothetical protein